MKSFLTVYPNLQYFPGDGETPIYLMKFLHFLLSIFYFSQLVLAIFRKYMKSYPLILVILTLKLTQGVGGGFRKIY